MSGVLEGIRVVDFGQYIAGPLAAMLLADQGAAVVRVDPPGGPRFHTPANAVWQRGKQSIVLDLKNADDAASARRLVERADVLIENFRAGVMERLGLGAETATAANPGLIFCSLPGFAADDPRAGLAAWEGVVGAATDTYRPARAGGSEQPVYTPVPIASNFAAFIAATGVVAALIERLQSGQGQRLDVPLFDAMFTAFGYRGFRIHAEAQRIEPGAGGGGAGGVYECADGRWVHFAPLNPRHLEWFVDRLGLAAWREDGLLDRARTAREPALAQELRRRVETLFKTATAWEWEARVNAIGIPLCVCRTPPEWLAEPHARASEAIIEVEDPEFGAMRQPGLPARTWRTPGAPSSGRHPLDSDHERIIADCGSRIADSATAPPPHQHSPRADAGPLNPQSQSPGALAGLRVLDLTQVWAGPTTGRTLAEFGADVIKINDPNQPILTHQDVNRAKRSLLLDLKTPEGREVFYTLVEGADVVMQNFQHGTAERLGIGYEDVKKHNPEVVYASVSAYGYIGPWHDRRGYEPVGHAATGMEWRFGGDGAPAMQPFAVNDYGTGILGAFAVALGLFHRARTGEGQQVDASLAYTATAHQTPFLFDYDGKVWDEPRGQGSLGAGPLQRLYQASDGWFFLGATLAQLPRLDSVPGLAGCAALKGDALATFLETRLASASVAFWVERLTAAGAGAHRLVTVAELMEDPWAEAHALSVTREHEDVGTVTTIGPAARLSRTPVTPGIVAPPPGSSAPEILREAGLRERLDALVAARAVVIEEAVRR